MNLTRKAIAERIKDIDVVIEVLDARLPGSSANPLLAELTGHKPTLKILNKQDIADPARTQLWLDHYNAIPGTRAISLQASEIGVLTPANGPGCQQIAMSTSSKQPALTMKPLADPPSSAGQP